MIHIADKHNCCGCSACVQACPKRCISFKEDEQGFYYPHVDETLCIDCGLCEKVCPCLYQNKTKKPQKVYAAINPDEEVRLKSSSGGIFTILAETIIEEGGVVFGARWDEEWNVKHDFTETKEGLEVFRGSKYVQSQIGDTYSQTRNFLEQGRKVLFSGTSCQIAGLKRYLRKEYENLITIDVVCHGVPSALVWKDYLRYINPQNETITEINLRDKSRGWSRYSYLIRNNEKSFYDDYAANSLFLQGFTWSLFLRPSCYNCPAKSGKSNSDITLADNWGFAESCPEMYDNKGISAILVNTEKGNDIINNIPVSKREIDFSIFTRHNKSYSKKAVASKYSCIFWDTFSQKGIEAVADIKLIMRPNLVRRTLSRIKRLFVK